MTPAAADGAGLGQLCVLFGALRSGTTMLRLMLASHPRLVCPGETDFLTDFLRPDPTAPSGWRYDCAALERSRIFRASRAELPSDDDGMAGFAAMTGQLRGDGDGLLVLVAHRGLERLLDLVPDLPVVHLLRDPRDVARSAIGMGWAGNVYYGADTWLGTETEWERCRGRLAPRQAHEIRYETLVPEPERCLSELCAFLGEAYDPAMLSYDGRSTYAAPDTTLVEQWRRKQSPRELALTEPRFGALLEARGYPPSGHPARRPGRSERLRLWLENKAGVWRTRIARYGLIDPVLLAVGRKLRLRPLEYRMLRRIDEKTQQRYLK